MDRADPRAARGLSAMRAEEIRERLMTAMVRRKMSRAASIPIEFEGQTFLFAPPTYDQAAAAWEESKGQPAVQRAILTARGLTFGGERVFQDGDVGMLMRDDYRHSLLAKIDPLLREMLSSADVKKPEAPTLADAHAIEFATTQDAEIRAGGCRRCGVATDKDCEHRKGRRLIRCASEEAECGHLVRRKGEFCALCQFKKGTHP